MKKRIYLTSILLLLVLIAALAVRWADRKGSFDLLAARIDNSGPVDSALVAEILEPFFGESLLSVSTDSIQLALGAIEGLRTVSVRVSFPHAILVEMTPEIPAAMLVSEFGTYPVTSSGTSLPESWSDLSLPVLEVEGSPRDRYLESGLELLLDMDLNDSATVVVCELGIRVLENGIPVLLDGNRAAADWETWKSIRSAVCTSAEQVDLRYSGQAVIRTAEGAEV